MQSNGVHVLHGTVHGDLYDGLQGTHECLLLLLDAGMHLEDGSLGANAFLAAPCQPAVSANHDFHLRQMGLAEDHVVIDVCHGWP